MMKVIDPNGRTTTWSFKGCRVLGGETRPRSAPHKRARALLAVLFPSYLGFEEVSVPGTRLRLDFVIPGKRLVVEVQGQQHYSYNPHFHKNKAEFLRSLARDRQKADFCGANDLTLVRLNHSESDDEWRHALENPEAAGG